MIQSYLLDTHILLWFLEGNQNLSSQARQIIQDTANPCFVSIASIWEIVIKLKLGKLRLGVEMNELRELLREFEIGVLPITVDHLLKLMDLPDIHRDPFDRVIIAQSMHEDLTLISQDHAIAQYQGLKLIS